MAGEVGQAVVEAFHLLLGGDPETWRAIGVSLQVSTAALAGAALAGTPLGLILALVPFPGRRWLRLLVRTLQAMPTVAIGLLLFLLLSRSGPLGSWSLLFTKRAMAVGQGLLVLPILASLVDAAASGADPRVVETALTLGAGWVRCAWLVLQERQTAVVAALVTAFARAFSEVGISLMVGGNIRGHTRNVTTSIVLEAGKGDFAQALALGMVLLAVALGLNLMVQVWEGRG